MEIVKTTVEVSGVASDLASDMSDNQLKYNLAQLEAGKHFDKCFLGMLLGLGLLGFLAFVLFHLCRW